LQSASLAIFCVGVLGFPEELIENITNVAGGDMKWHGTKMEFAYGFDAEMASKMDIMISAWHANS
jgi:hypothetical protein